MATHVALLRGINVGGRNRVAMADLRDAVTALGHRDVRTVLQSGNVVLTSDEPDPEALASAMERAVADACGVRADVVVLPAAALARVAAANPFPDEDDPTHLHVRFARGAGGDGRSRGAGAAEALAAAVERARAAGSRDDARAAAGAVYLRTPDGLGRSRLAAELERPAVVRALGGPGTLRNWATVTRLLDLLDG